MTIAVTSFVNQTSATTDKVVKALSNMAAACPEIRRVFLFGSRARGDQRERSDYDFALETFSLSNAQKAKFISAWEEQKPTLLATDLVWLDAHTTVDLQTSIKREGVVVYERPDTT